MERPSGFGARKLSLEEVPSAQSSVMVPVYFTLYCLRLSRTAVRACVSDPQTITARGLFVLRGCRPSPMHSHKARLLMARRKMCMYEGCWPHVHVHVHVCRGGPCCRSKFRLQDSEAQNRATDTSGVLGLLYRGLSEGEPFSFHGRARGCLEREMQRSHLARPRGPLRWRTARRPTVMESALAFKKALEKKLRQIEGLQKKRDAGVALDASQKQKLQREAELRVQLSEAEARLAQSELSLVTTREAESLEAEVENAAPPPPEPQSEPEPALPPGTPEAILASLNPAPGDAPLPSISTGSRLHVDGRKAKIKSIVGEPASKIKVKFSDDDSKAWLQLPLEWPRVSQVRPSKAKPAEPPLPPSPPADPPLPPSLSAAPPASTAARPSPPVFPSPGSCNHCGKSCSSARLCTFGLGPGETIMRCSGRTPVSACFPRVFIVPLRRAAATFDADGPNLRLQGRLDVGLRCVSSALFRSQSLRNNTSVLLCFGEGPPRVLEVNGALVRDARPDEASLAKRIRAVSDIAGAARAQAAADAAARESLSHIASPSSIPDDGPLGQWSRGATRGLSSRDGDLLAAIEGALAQPGPPPILLLLTATGEFIGSMCTELAARVAGASPPPISGVVVLLGDDRGLSHDEERTVLHLASVRGAEVRRVSLGEDVLFASHSIVLVHHYLDRLLHSCLVRPPRMLVRGGGQGASGRGRGGKGKGSRN